MKKLDSLCYSARVRECARLGHAGPSDADLDRLEREHSRLALVAARHAGRVDRLLAALLDPRESVTGTALALLRTLHPMPDLLEILPQCCPAVRSGLISIASIRATPEQAAGLIALVEERYGPQPAANLLRALSPQDLDRFLSRLAPRLRNWAGLARRHPDAVLAWLRETLQAAPEGHRMALWQRCQSAMRELAEKRPEALLSLARELHPPERLPPLPLAYLALRHPEQVLQLLLTGQHPFPAHLRRLGPERLGRLAVHVAHDPLRVAALLEACPPAWRADLFRAAYGAADCSARVWPPRLLAALPHELRLREAERMLSLRGSQVSPRVALETAVYASPARAEALLEPESKAAQAEDRARAVAGWIQNCALNRGDLTGLLTRLVPRLRNEQDPVRLAACGALRQAPPSLFGPASLKPLGELVTAVTQARDTSWGTRTHLQQLGMALLRRGALEPSGPLLPFSLDLQRKLVQQSGNLAWPRLDDLPRGAEQSLFEALQRWIKAANERDAYGPVLSLGLALGKRARGVPGLQKLIAEATRAKPDWIALQAINLWLEDPSVREARVRSLLDKDESTIVSPRVFETLHRRRQDWLDPFLTPRVLKGRFASSKTLYLLPAQNGFQRWLTRQQLAFARGLLAVARDAKRSDHERASTLHRLCRLPAMGLADLEPFLNDSYVPVLEAALSAATHLDRPSEALETLLGHLDSDRARVAMYAIPRVARFTAPGVLGRTLRDLLARPGLKVTVQKEALRLLGAHRVPGGEAILQDQWARPELHRDVRIAVLHAARALTAWPLLEAAARHEDGSVARSLLDQSPDQLGAESRQDYAELVTTLAFHADPRTREAAFLALPRWAAGLEPRVARVLAEAVLDLSQGPEWKAAATGLVEVAREGRSTEVVRETAGRLAALPDEPEAGAERDRPASQRWQFLAGLLAAIPWRQRKALGLGDLPGLGVAFLVWPELEGVEALCAGPVAEQVLAPFERELADPGFEWTGLEIALERLLAGNPTARRMALRLVTAAGARGGWEPFWRDRLRALRQDPDPVVAWEASRRYTVPE